MVEFIAVQDDDVDKLLSGVCSVEKILRASHVEPEVINGAVVWFADLSPIEGPLLGPFDTRKEALEKEHEWLDSNVISHKDQSIL